MTPQELVIDPGRDWGIIDPMKQKAYAIYEEWVKNPVEGDGIPALMDSLTSHFYDVMLDLEQAQLFLADALKIQEAAERTRDETLSLPIGYLIRSVETYLRSHNRIKMIAIRRNLSPKTQKYLEATGQDLGWIEDVSQEDFQTLRRWGVVETPVTDPAIGPRAAAETFRLTYFGLELSRQAEEYQ